MRIIMILALLAPLLAPQAASTADLTVSLEGITEYDNNAFRSENDEKKDVLFRMRPGVRVHEDRGEDLRWSLEYQVPFEFAVEHGNALDDIDQYVRGDATYHVNERLELFANDSFRYLRSALREVGTTDVVAGDDNTLINQNRDRVTMNDAELGARYQFSPRLNGSLVASNRYFDPDRPDRAKNWLLSGRGDVSYLLTPRHTVGVGVQYFYQNFDATDFIVGSQANSYNAYLQWTYRVDETLSFSVAGGPTYIDVNQDNGDAFRTSPAIPSVSIGAGTNLTGLGLLRPDGTAASGVLAANGLVVSQVDGCPEVGGPGGTPVFNGTICPINPGSPTTAGVVVDPVDTTVAFDAVRDSVSMISNPAPDGENESSLDFFAQAVIAKHWSENLHTALRYERTQGGASGLGGTVIRDSIDLSNTWDVTERWQVALRGDWTLRKSVTQSTAEFVVAGAPTDPVLAGLFTGTNPAGAVGLATVRGTAADIDTMRWGTAGRVTYRFFRNTSGWVQLTYNEQNSQSDTLGNPSDFRDFLASVGLRHVFQPIKLW